MHNARLLGQGKGDLRLQTTKGRFDYLDCVIIAARINDSAGVLNQTLRNNSELMYLLYLPSSFIALGLFFFFAIHCMDVGDQGGVGGAKK